MILIIITKVNITISVKLIRYKITFSVKLIRYIGHAHLLHDQTLDNSYIKQQAQTNKQFRERERGERETHRQTDRQTDRQTERQIQTETDTKRDRDIYIDRECQITR